MLKWIATLIAVTSLFGACSTEQIYYSTTGIRTQDCTRLPQQDRTACVGAARMSYPEYETLRRDAGAR